MRTSLLWIACLSVLIGCERTLNTIADHVPTQPAVASDASVVSKGTEDRAFVVVELTGSPEQIGTQHGQALGEPMRSLLTDYLGKYFRNSIDKAMALGAAALFEPYILPEHQAEIRALAESSGVAEGETLLAQCFLDLSAMTACSTIALPAEASPDGIPRFGRNLDFPALGLADKHTVVRVYRPTDHYGFVEIGWPGMIGVLSGMNEHGLALANMEVNRGRRMPSAMPYTLLYRSVLERCRTVDEAIAHLEATPRQSSNNLMLMDASGDRAVVEITPEQVVVRRADADQALISTNHQRAQDHTRPGQCRRYDTLRQTSEATFGQIDRDGVQEMLRDVQADDMTLQSMIFEPTTRTIWLATGARAAEREMAKIDLRDHFTNAK